MISTDYYHRNWIKMIEDTGQTRQSIVLEDRLQTCGLNDEAYKNFGKHLFVFQFMMCIVQNLLYYIHGVSFLIEITR
jgi:hypothetical protein